MNTETSVPPGPFRDIPVDILRGFAIALMIGANVLPYILTPPAPLWLRTCASLAAPLFIFISGMMVALSKDRKNYDLRYFLVRGGVVILIAALLELASARFLPFTDVDVLYLIGISLPLAYLFLSLRTRTRWLIIAAIFCITPVLQFIFGYAGLPLQIPISGAVAGLPLDPFAILHSWFIDGWFPLFPWLGISLLGAQLGVIRWKSGRANSFATPKTVYIALGLLMAGLFLWMAFPARLFTRLGFVELFYPPTTAFLITIIGVILCLFIFADRLPLASRIIDPIRAMGECSLAIYIIHSLIIVWLIAPLNLSFSLPGFGISYALFVCGMIAVAYEFRRVRPGNSRRNIIARMLIGG